jgi:hypothetical protein
VASAKTQHQIKPCDSQEDDDHDDASQPRANKVIKASNKVNKNKLTGSLLGTSHYFRWT